MAKDDYFVIVYRLLKYLYDCLKKSVKPDMNAIDADFFGIDSKYWTYIIRNLHNDGYVEGVALFKAAGMESEGVKIRPHFGITPKGILYLEENSVFQKVKDIVKDIADIVPIV